ncbi:MAG: CvpA family protein [Muribaculaceae bacterium]|nr:CvpA family protein [Muribaculaceae bacterium]
MSLVFQLVIIAVVIFATVRGFRLGFARQTPAIIGTAFGIICARLLAPGLDSVLYGAFPSVHGKVEERYLYDTLSSGIVFFCIYAIFRTITSFLGNVLASTEHTILDNISGALFLLFKYLLFLSIVYNYLCGSSPESPLRRCARSDDANAVQEVMLIAPSLLGGEDIVDFSHKIQLEEAKKIS